MRGRLTEQLVSCDLSVTTTVMKVYSLFFVGCLDGKDLWLIMFMGPCIVSIFQYISNKMQRYTVYLYLETALRVSGGTSTHHQERIHLYLQHLVFFVRHPQHTQTRSISSTIAADSSNGVKNTRCCRYRCMRSWWWVEVPPEICRAVFRYK
jgi:hypothetical protein